MNILIFNVIGLEIRTFCRILSDFDFNRKKVYNIINFKTRFEFSRDWYPFYLQKTNSQKVNFYYRWGSLPPVVCSLYTHIFHFMFFYGRRSDIPIFKLILYNVFHVNGMQFYFTMTFKKTKSIYLLKMNFIFSQNNITLFCVLKSPWEKIRFT